MIRIHAILAAAMLAFSGCTQTTAFDAFKMDEEHERAITNLRTATIVRSFETKAIVSTIYLNATLPKQYNGEYEHFFVALYLQDDIRLYYKANLNAPDGRLTLNGIEPTNVRELKKDDRLRTLMPIKNEWNRYYHITYPRQKGNILKLTLESDRYGKAELMYQKDPE